MSILTYFPAHLTPSAEQVKILTEVEAAFDTYDVLSILAPTASGKTELMLTISRWLTATKSMSSNLLEPTNILVDQFTQRYPEVKPLHRKDSYTCDEYKDSCPGVKEIRGSYCKGCVFKKAVTDTKKSRVRLMNFYVYWSHKLYADVLLFDEAHQVLDMLQDKKEVKLWRGQFNFPDDLKLVSDVIEWAQGYLRKTPDERLNECLRQVIRIQSASTISYEKMWRWGKSDTVLRIIPNSKLAVPPWLWPVNKVRKIILLSATISPLDVEEMNLGERRVKYLECGSRIPPANRPVIYDPSYNLGHQYTEMALPAVLRKVRELLAAHPDKGLIHVPYNLAEKLRDQLNDPRLLFHDRENKTWALEQFKLAAPETGRVLVASGLYEGVDLPYDAARWQMILKTPYMSLGDSRVAIKAKENPAWYQWEAIKRVLQASGRIVRAPDDFGVTYICDASFGRLLDADVHRDTPLFPTWFRAAFIDQRRKKK